MKKIPIILSLLLVIFSQAIALLEIRHREYPLSKEQRFRVEVSLNFGEIKIARSTTEKIAIIDYEEAVEAAEKLAMTYTLDGATGVLRITLKDKMNVDIFGSDSKSTKNQRRLTLYVTDRLPLEMKVEVGAGKCDIDLSGILLESFSLSAGAASVTVSSFIPNKITSTKIKIECGVGKFVGKQLANLNFRELSFEGGVGSYSLNFDGILRQNGTVTMEVGVGSVSITLPKSMAAKIYRDENWLSSFHIEGNFEKIRPGMYETKDFSSQPHFLTFRLQSGLGSFSVKQ